ncbi:hypothetical protein AHAS_Ahas09G0066800 [Arachis hypogaea]
MPAAAHNNQHQHRGDHVAMAAAPWKGSATPAAAENEDGKAGRRGEEDVGEEKNVPRACEDLEKDEGEVAETAVPSHVEETEGTLPKHLEGSG